MTERQLKNFWSKVNKTDTCWNWIGGKTGGDIGKRYGRVNWSSGQHYAHHISWELHHGAIPKGMCILHTCDNSSCVNPEHLFLGTAKDNVQDMIKKGRSKLGLFPCLGEKHGMSKLKLSDVITIRQAYRRGIFTMKFLGELFGVQETTIGKIINWKSWKNVSNVVL